MRAAFYEQNGAARAVLRLGEIATPEPGPGEVRVRLATSRREPVRRQEPGRHRPQDGLPAGGAAQRRGGHHRARRRRRSQLASGRARLDLERPVEAPARHRGGIHRPAGRPGRALPVSVGFDGGACLGIPALTAWQAVMGDGSVAGKAVLVAKGGAGAVGHYAVQIAKAGGARVLATVSGPVKAAHAVAAGADHAINYRSEDVGARVRELTGGRGVDRVVEMDITANARLLPGVLAPRGTITIYGIGGPEAPLPAPFCLFAAVTVKFFLVYDLLGRRAHGGDRRHRPADGGRPARPRRRRRPAARPHRRSARDGRAGARDGQRRADDRVDRRS